MTDATALLDHQIILAHDKIEAATFLATILDLPAPVPQSIFMAVTLGNDVTLLFKQVTGPITAQHVAFRVPKERFAEMLERAESNGVRYWATPKGEGIGETYTLGGETGFYFHDPSGHQFEILCSD